MELYVSGFNAWGQLCFDDVQSRESETANTEDVQTFTSALRVNTTSSVRVRAFLSYTSATFDGRNEIAGYFPSEHRRLRDKDSQAYDTLVEASNGIVAYIDATGAARQFASIHDALGGALGQTFPVLLACTQLVAYETGFMALTSRGNVYTWGDERYGACLGREPSKRSPANEPGLVIALQDLPTGPIVKVAAGGYTLAALTGGNDLYMWGGHLGRKDAPADLSDEPTPIDISDEDIADVAIGESHVLISTVSGRVLAVGANSNGQLGSLGKSVDSWTPVGLDLLVDTKVVQIAAGPRNSFVVAERDEAS